MPQIWIRVSDVSSRHRHITGTAKSIWAESTSLLISGTAVFTRGAIFGWSLIAILALVSCASSDSDEGTSSEPEIRPPTPTPVITTENGVKTLVVHLSPTEGEGQTGTATFIADGSTTTVEIVVTPIFTEAQPIHIHSGICTEVGPVIHALENVVRGTSVTLIESPIEDILSKGALVNVHASYTDASNYTACGKLPQSLE